MDRVEDFFNKNSENWRENYPGLNLKRLQNEFQAYTGRVGSQYDNQTGLATVGPYWDNFTSFLKNGVPLQYISRQAYFYKSEFYVDERVLIPRSETEILVEHACDHINSLSKNEVHVYEVGVGSGCIGLSLLQEISEKKVSYIGTDISKEALEVFKINQFRHDFKIAHVHDIETRQTDRLEGLTKSSDLIMSNPPYIKEVSDQALVHPQVKRYEPMKALFLEDDKYEAWFKDFFTASNNLLNDGGLFLMEGHENHLLQLSVMAKEIFNKDVTIIKDYTNRQRFIKVVK